MKLKLLISNQAGRFIKKLPPKQYKQVVHSTLSLMSNPEPHDSKHLIGSEKGNWRVDIGEYRIVYRVDGDELKVLVIGKRNDDHVYKILDRQ